METTKSIEMPNMMKSTPRLKIPMTTTIAPQQQQQQPKKPKNQTNYDEVTTQLY